MDSWLVVAAVLGAGVLGGLVNSLITGEVRLPRTDQEARVWHPGWVGNALVGGVAAVVFWGLYGPFAGYALVGTVASVGGSVPAFTVGDLCGAVVTGLGGGQILTREVDRRVSTKELDALSRAKNSLISALAEQLP